MITGSGQQKLGVLVNIFSFYVVAIPVALTLAFHLHWGERRLQGGCCS